MSCIIDSLLLVLIIGVLVAFAFLTVDIYRNSQITETINADAAIVLGAAAQN